MGAIAGKVMIRPRGDYDPSAVYNRLDLVKYDNKPWLCCKNNVVGITPRYNDLENWMNIIDVSIANADTLDGYDSDYFATAADVIRLMRNPIQATFRASDWSTTAPYTQTVTADGITDADTPTPSFVDNGTNKTDSDAKRKSYGFISHFDSGDGVITATCKYRKPTLDFTVAFKGV